MNPKYPVYIISKGRAYNPMTANALRNMGVPFRIVIEPQELEEYAKVIPIEWILLLPFSNLGQGSIPARNWVWEHSISEGHERHWILDDNINHFKRANGDKKYRVNSGTIFKCAEDFTDRYENVGISGLNYDWFCVMGQSDRKPPYYLNTRIYSCILLNNKISHRWRGKYNEDTDLSLRILKDGYCSILFNAFLAAKAGTMQMKGGNTDNVYIDGDNRMKFAQSLVDQHPDCVKVTFKYGRWHHQVDYRRFRLNKLIKKQNLIIPRGINNYGMKLIDLRETEIEIKDPNQIKLF